MGTCMYEYMYTLNDWEVHQGTSSRSDSLINWSQLDNKYNVCMYSMYANT